MEALLGGWRRARRDTRSSEDDESENRTGQTEHTARTTVKRRNRVMSYQNLKRQ